MSTDSVLEVVYLAVGLLVALVAHEAAHAFTAVRLGDHTPRAAGRLTLDPRPHVDPFGTLVLPVLLLLPVLFGRVLFPVFAYAKPYEVNPWNLTRRDRHAAFVAVAGPVANVVLAFVFGILFRLTGGTGEVARVLGASVAVNVIMAVLQVVPVPGLDGARIISRFLPVRAREVFSSLEQYLALFILVVFFVIPGPIFAFVRVIGNGICRIAAGGDCL